MFCTYRREKSIIIIALMSLLKAASTDLISIQSFLQSSSADNKLSSNFYFTIKNLSITFFIKITSKVLHNSKLTKSNKRSNLV